MYVGVAEATLGRHNLDDFGRLEPLERSSLVTLAIAIAIAIAVDINHRDYAEREFFGDAELVDQ